MGSTGSGFKALYTIQEQKIFDDLRPRKKEKLVVYDDNGNIVYTEGGTKGHTGYSSDYTKTGMHTVHNHPEGYGPYPSQTDLDSFYSGGYKSLTIVSKDYTVTIAQDDAYKHGGGYGPISYRYIEDLHKLPTAYEAIRRGGMSAEEYNRLKRENEFHKLLEAGRRAGYRVTITDEKTKKVTRNRPMK